MKLARHALPLAVLTCCIPALAHAQSGCTDSPEASTDVLMLVGAVGMVHGSHLLRKLANRSRR